MHDDEFYALLDRLGFSREGYRKVRKGVKKRIRRHMLQIGCSNLVDYLERLQADPVLMDQLNQRMTVSISRFFRDRRLWTALEKEIFPERTRMNPEEIRVWSAGCACGEEVYSIKIVWERLRRRQKNLPAFAVTATDSNPVFLQKAQAGVYTRSSLNEVDPEDLESFFKPVPGNRFEVLPVLKDGIVWDRKDHLLDPPETSFQLIFLRNNVLTYLEDSLKRKAFENVMEGLAPCGILIIGSHEELPGVRADLVPVEPFSYVFR
ncbi:MAG: hypothetical protein C4530_19190 [Desulfobacteraceae bacterium]|nr:MAG: hypothetical protein C4530_19190 [Desulfobacteraceae bacterium]